MKLFLVLLGLSLLCLPSFAQPHKLEAENFGIELPSGWQVIDPPISTALGSTRRVFTAQSSDANRLIMITVAPPLRSAGEIDTYFRSQAATISDKGWRVSAARDETIAGLPFTYSTVSMTPDQPAFMFNAATFTTSHIYGITCIKKDGDASTDTQLRAVLESFHLLTPVTSLRRATR